MSTNTGTRTGTQTSSYTQVVHVTRKVQADFIAIMDTYNYLPEAYAVKLITDLRTYLDNEVIEAVKFTWKDAGTNVVMEELRYVVIAGGIGLADDRPGGILYKSTLKTADFQIYLTYNDLWKRMDETQKQVVRNDLLLSWGPAGTLDYSNGSWLGADKTYSKDGLGVSRHRFER